jgi:hypothetical protein
LNKLLSYIKRPFLEAGNAWDIVKVMMKDGRVCIVTPETDAALSAEQNYMRQFETRIFFAGDLIYYLAPQKVYASKEEWEAQLSEHQVKVDEFKGQLNNFDALFMLAAGSFSTVSSLLSAKYLFNSYDLWTLAMGAGSLILHYLLKDFLLKILMKALVWWLQTKTKVGSFFK